MTSPGPGTVSSLDSLEGYSRREQMSSRRGKLVLCAQLLLEKGTLVCQHEADANNFIRSMSLLPQSRKSQMFLALCATLFQANFGFGEELPVETFFQNYQYSQVELSPDGNHLAALASVHKRLALAVLDLQSRVPTWAFAHRALNVGWYCWANTNRLFLELGKDGTLFDLYSV